jgi:putative FmdB family regulatory protein
MPIYEYRCEPCDHTFETLVRSAGDVARCPKCGNIEVAKQFSVPAAAQSGSSSSLPICGNPEAARALGCGGGHCGSGMCGLE